MAMVVVSIAIIINILAVDVAAAVLVGKKQSVNRRSAARSWMTGAAEPGNPPQMSLVATWSTIVPIIIISGSFQPRIGYSRRTAGVASV